MNRIAVISLALLCACTGVVETYNPGPSPLLRKAFEQRLVNEGINFTIDDRGYYSAAPKEMEKLKTIGVQAISLTNSTTYLPAEEGCPKTRMQKHLEDQRILFTLETFEGKPKFHVTKLDFEKHKLIENYSSFVFACEKSQ